MWPHVILRCGKATEVEGGAIVTPFVRNPMESEEFAPLNLHGRCSTKYLNEGCCYCCYAAGAHYSFTLIILRLEINLFFQTRERRNGELQFCSFWFQRRRERKKKREFLSLPYSYDAILYKREEQEEERVSFSPIFLRPYPIWPLNFV